ncbi:hypothetical protein OsI_12388 [Oryza sativa Indica Group]|uniref:Proteasome maturation factor UMP1 family protein n=1 Tax=Oryza sativa subsp. indica TaxID=39946 RepID=A2XIX6_ORYSI|nr:hypothetical protein OsI_12388 [Oryza sativa Indica Group]
MASGSIVKKEVGENHDVLLFGVNNSVKGDLAPQHPIQATVHKEAKFWADKKRFGAEAIYGSAFNIRKDLDAQILSKFQRPPGALPSSMLGYEALTGSLDDFGFEDYLNLPQDSDSFHAPDMHHGMEKNLLEIGICKKYIHTRSRGDSGGRGVQLPNLAPSRSDPACPALEADPQATASGEVTARTWRWQGEDYGSPTRRGDARGRCRQVDAGGTSGSRRLAWTASGGWRDNDKEASLTDGVKVDARANGKEAGLTDVMEVNTVMTGSLMMVVCATRHAETD